MWSRTIERKKERKKRSPVVIGAGLRAWEKGGRGIFVAV